MGFSGVEILRRFVSAEKRVGVNDVSECRLLELEYIVTEISDSCIKIDLTW